MLWSCGEFCLVFRKSICRYFIDILSQMTIDYWGHVSQYLHMLLLDKMICLNCSKLEKCLTWTKKFPLLIHCQVFNCGNFPASYILIFNQTLSSWVLYSIFLDTWMLVGLSSHHLGCTSSFGQYYQPSWRLVHSVHLKLRNISLPPWQWSGRGELFVSTILVLVCMEMVLGFFLALA